MCVLPSSPCEECLSRLELEVRSGFGQLKLKALVGARQGRETYSLRCFDPLFQTMILETSRNGFLHGSDSVRSQHDFLQYLRSSRAMCFLVDIFSRNVAQCCGAGFQKVGHVIGLATIQVQGFLDVRVLDSSRCCASQ